jgi:hypothetical protein
MSRRKLDKVVSWVSLIWVVTTLVLIMNAWSAAQ